MGRPVRCLPSSPFIKYSSPTTTTTTTTFAPGEDLLQYIIIPTSGVACPGDGGCDIKILNITCDIVIQEINLSAPSATTTTTTTTAAPGNVTTTSTTTTLGPFVYPSNIVSNNAIYSQTSRWSQNLLATALSMNNKTHIEIFETVTNADGLQWIRMDLGSIFNIKNVIIGCDFNNTLRTTVTGSAFWGKTYTENKPIQYSVDSINWINLGNTGTFSTPMKVFAVNINARYIRITNNGAGYLAATEFAAGT
jgi:hypothetical protein